MWNFLWFTTAVIGVALYGKLGSDLWLTLTNAAIGPVRF